MELLKGIYEVINGVREETNEIADGINDLLNSIYSLRQSMELVMEFWRKLRNSWKGILEAPELSHIISQIHVRLLEATYGIMRGSLKEVKETLRNSLKPFRIQSNPEGNQ